jgi:hypothetical protein
VQDETGAGIPAASLTTLTLTVYAVIIGNPLVNGIDHVNVLNAGRGTVDALGNVVVLLAPADMLLVNLVGVPEQHIMLLEYTYASGAKEGVHEVVFTVLPVIRL